MNTNPDTHGVSKVVVGVDGSSTSAAAGGWAARLATTRFCASIAPALGASVIALTAEDPESTDQDPAEWMTPLRASGTAMQLLDQTKVPMVSVPPGTSTGLHEHHRHEPDVRSGGGV